MRLCSIQLFLLLLTSSVLVSCKVENIQNSLISAAPSTRIDGHPLIDVIADQPSAYAGTLIEIDANDEGDDFDEELESLTYSCIYDTTIDGSVVAGSACAGLSTTNFTAATGVFEWTPGYSDVGGVYEIKITASDGINIDEEIFSIQIVNTVDPFISTWLTTASNETITLPLKSGASYDFYVDWGDGNNDHITSWSDSAKAHTYVTPGNYTINIYGLHTAWYFLGGADNSKLLTVPSLGSVGWTNLGYAFKDCNNLTTFNGGDTSRVTLMYGMFDGATNVTPDTSGWNTSNVTNMYSMFAFALAANPDTSNWDTSNVTNFSYMFQSAVVANPDTSGWDTSSATNMSRIFYDATSAVPDTSGWDTSNVTNMQGMFYNATLADPDTSGWDTSLVTDMDWMFVQASSANPDVSGWDTSNVTGMIQLFRDASNANPDVSGWDTSLVSDMNGMFRNAASANPDMSTWDFANVTDMSLMLNGSGISVNNYSNMLIQIDATSSQTSVILGATGIQYDDENSAVTTARANLVGPMTWTIFDGGPD